MFVYLDEPLNKGAGTSQRGTSQYNDFSKYDRAGRSQSPFFPVSVFQRAVMQRVHSNGTVSARESPFPPLGINRDRSELFGRGARLKNCVTPRMDGNTQRTGATDKTQSGLRPEPKGIQEMT